MLVPVLFGSGKPLFREGRPAGNAHLLEVLPLDTGAAILQWRLGD